MGRDLKRVPLDFAQPLNERWPGYLNPHYTATKCPVCEGRGDSALARQLHDRWYGNDPEYQPETPIPAAHPAIQRLAQHNAKQLGSVAGVFALHLFGILPQQPITGDRLVELEAKRLAEHFNRQWSNHLTDEDLAVLRADEVCGPRLAQYTDEQLRWSHIEGSLFGPVGSSEQWTLIKYHCAKAGVSTDCTAPGCDDGAIWPSAEDKARYEAWEPTEPPEGPGYQLWENVTEGSPISPVFPDEASFINYLISEGYSRQAAEGFTRVGYAPSMIMQVDTERRTATTYSDIEAGALYKNPEE